MRRWGVLAVSMAGLIVSGSALADDGSTPSYDFRGARLGMTLDEFRALPFPDNSAYLSGRSVCSGDTEITPKDEMVVFSAVTLAPYEEKLGIVKCAFYQSSTHQIPGTNRAFTIWRPAWVLAGSHPGEFTYSFAPPSPGEQPTLYEVSADNVRIAGASALISGLTERFGPPSSDEAGSMQVRSGAVFPRRSVRWDNGRQSITVIAPGRTSDTLSVTYRQTEQADEVRRQREAVVGSPGSRL